MRRKKFLKASVAFLALVGMCVHSGALADIIYPEASGKKQLANDVVTVDISNRELGYIMIRHSGSPMRLKATTIHDGKMYQYDINENGEYETYPLSEGNGEYIIGVYEQVAADEDDYLRVFNGVIDVFMPDPLSVFKIPNQYVWFTDESALVRKSDEICAGLMSDFEKINALYDFVTEHIIYDYVKAVTLRGPYLPNTDETLATGRGICFDFAVLLAGMLRAQGIPTQLVVGKLYASNPPISHAWNKVFLDGNWLMMDSTVRTNSISQSKYVEERVY